MVGRASDPCEDPGIRPLEKRILEIQRDLKHFTGAVYANRVGAVVVLRFSWNGVVSGFGPVNFVTPYDACLEEQAFGDTIFGQ